MSDPCAARPIRLSLCADVHGFTLHAAVRCSGDGHKLMMQLCRYITRRWQCGNNRVVFNVGGNKYRLVLEMQYQAVIVWVKFVGTHA